MSLSARSSAASAPLRPRGEVVAAAAGTAGALLPLADALAHALGRAPAEELCAPIDMPPSIGRR
jgi:hypothetical protein